MQANKRRHLFRGSLETLLEVNAPVVQTPLGALKLEATIDGMNVFDLQPSTMRPTGQDGDIFRWKLDQFQAELLFCAVEPPLPEGMRVDGCWAVIWRVRAYMPIEEIEFGCEWAAGYRWTDGGPDSGQWLDAQTWDDGSVQVTLGTEDAEAMAARASRNARLPSRWGTVLGVGREKTDPIVYTDSGFRLVLPNMREREMCQVGFQVAWSPAAPTAEDARNVPLYTSNWYAVQQSPECVMTQVSGMLR